MQSARNAFKPALRAATVSADMDPNQDLPGSVGTVVLSSANRERNFSKSL